MDEDDGLGFIVKRLVVGGIAGLALGYCHKRGYALTPKAVEIGIKFGPAFIYGAKDAARTFPGTQFFSESALCSVVEGGASAAVVGVGTFLGYCVANTIS